MSFASALAEFGSEGALKEFAVQLMNQYGQAQPFPHIALDDFFPASLLREVGREFSDQRVVEFEEICSRHQRSSCQKFINEKKTGVHDVWKMGPCTQLAFMLLRSPQFVSFLELVTGIRGIIPDPHFSGSGLHMTRAGGKLGVHADFNSLEGPYRGLDRRVNLFLFLNEDWRPEYGGELELWRQDLTTCEARIAPAFGRLVFFSSTDFTYHGHPEPLRFPPERSRRSLVLYYYTNGRPEGESVGYDHTTLFQDVNCRMSAVEDLVPQCEVRPDVLMPGMPNAGEDLLKTTRALSEDSWEGQLGS